MKIFIMDLVEMPKNYKEMDGSNIHKWELIYNLLKLGNDIHVLSAEECNPKHENLRIHTVPKTIVFKRLTRLIILLKLIKNNDFDVIYTRTPANISGFAGLTAKKIFGIPLVFEINGISFQEQSLIKKTNDAGNFLKFFLAELRKYKEIFMWRQADKVIAVTPGIKNFLIENGVSEEKITIIENGANTDLFKPLNQKNLRKQLGLNEKFNYVCFVGNFAPWQGLEYLVKASKLVVREIDAKFLMVGDGLMRQNLEHMIEESGLEDHFIFIGRTPYKEVPKYINLGDICVAPFLKARNENIGLSPLKIYEYMACCKPIVASRIMNLEFIEEQNAGILVEPENETELAKAIIELISQKEFRIVGDKSREYIMENHSWKGVAKKVESVCKNLHESS